MTDSNRSPTMSGGLFAIDRDFFNYIGKYDEGMIIWGAENLEFSFRVIICIDESQKITKLFLNNSDLDMWWKY